jgi:sugar lactone lactonase YvrE
MSERSSRGRIVRLLMLAGTVVLLGVAWYGQRAFQYAVPRAPGGWIMLAAVAALAVVVVGSSRSREGEASAEPLIRRCAGDTRLGGSLALPRHWEWSIVAALCALGIVFRLIHFYTVPEGMNHDAGWYGQYANEIVRGTAYTPYVSAAWGRETLFMYVVAAFIPLFGNTPEALQAASALWGIVALLPFYLLARAMFTPAAALIGLGLFAVSGWHGVFSRAGWRVITVPPFEMIALLGAWQVGRRGKLRDWVVLGAGAAGSIYTYNAARIIPVMCGVYALAVLIAHRGHWRRNVGGAAVALATFVAVGGPMLWYAVTHFDQFQSRAAYLEQERAARGLWGNVLAAAGLFTYRGNGNDFFINEPLLEPMAGVLFALGVLVAVYRWRHPASLFLLGGLVLALLPGVLAVPNGNRCITALPLVYLLIAFAAQHYVGAISAASKRGRALTFAVAAVLIVITAVESYSELLGPTRRTLTGFSPGATAAGLTMRRFIDRYKLFTVASWPENTLTYLAYDGHGSPFEREYVWGHSYQEIEPEISPFGAKGLLFMLDIDPPGLDALAQLRRRFPEHRLEPLLPPRVGSAPLGHLFFVDRRSPAEQPPPNAFDGVHGQAPAEFNEPMGLTFDPSGNLYVAERLNHRIQKFAADGTFIRAWGTEGGERGEFREPLDVAADERFVYVADTWNQRIQIFTPDGAAVSEIRGDPSFVGPRGIFVRDGHIYLVDTGRGVVRTFDSAGKMVAVIGERDGEAPGHLLEPIDVVTDRAGRLYVVNSGNNRIEVFDVGGQPTATFPISGWEGHGIKEGYLAIDRNDILYLSDPATQRVRRFTTSGEELAPIVIPRLDFPSGIAVNDDLVAVSSRRWHTVKAAALN